MSSKKKEPQTTSELADKIAAGDFGAWEASKSNPELLVVLASPKSNPESLLERLLACDRNGAIPDDLFELALSLAAQSRRYRADRWEPQITQHNMFSLNDRNSHPVHDLIGAGRHREAMRILQSIPVSEYGTSGRDPLDSALSSCDYATIEAFRKQDPIALIRPRLSAAKRVSRSGTENEVYWELGYRGPHIPLKAFLESFNPFAGQSRRGGQFGIFERNSGANGRSGEKFHSLIELHGDWLDAIYAACGSKAQRDEWQKRRIEFLAEMDPESITGDMFGWFSQEIDAAIKELGIQTKSMPSYIEYMGSPQYGIDADQRALQASRLGADAGRYSAPAKKTGGLVCQAAAQKNLSVLAGVMESGTRMLTGRFTREQMRDIADRMSAGPQAAGGRDEDGEEGEEEEALPSKGTPQVRTPPVAPQVEPAASPKALSKMSSLCAARTAEPSLKAESTRELGRAICQGDFARVQKALAQGADPNGKIGKSDRMIHRAVAVGNAEAAKNISVALVAAGADPALANGSGLGIEKIARHQDLVEWAKGLLARPSKSWGGKKRQ